MEAEIPLIVAAPAPPPANNADLDLPLLSLPDAPRSSECILIILLALLYLVPGLFFDPTAQALVEWCRLDPFIDSGF